MNTQSAFARAFPRRVRGWACTLLLGLLTAGAWADEPTPLSAESRRERLQVIRRIVQTIDTSIVIGEGVESAALLAEPSLLYADNTRDVADSSLWVWEHEGRPVGVTALEWNHRADAASPCTYEFASLSPAALRLTLPQGNWTATSGVAAPRALLSAPAPAATRARRSLQIKQLAERFTAVELHRGQGRIELRRLAAPVYRQAETTPGDSALFVFANGTNPEVVLALGTLEAQGGSVWAYTLGARCARRKPS